MIAVLTRLSLLINACNKGTFAWIVPTIKGMVVPNPSGNAALDPVTIDRIVAGDRI